MREEKQLLLDEIKDQFTSHPSFLIMRYNGMTANQSHEFRTKVVSDGGCVEVVPKRVLLKAAGAIEIEIDPQLLDGHIGLIFTGEDPLVTTKTVFDFGKDNSGVLEILAGRIDGQMYNASDVETLSKLPGKDQMRAQFLGLLEAPLSQTLALMDALMTSVIYCLENKAKQD